MEIIVGKKGNQKIAITDSRVSRNHCKLTEQADGSFILEDLNSTNGTFVNGSSVIKNKVNRDTIIQLGPELKIKVADLVGPPKEPECGNFLGDIPFENLRNRKTYGICKCQWVK